MNLRDNEQNLCRQKNHGDHIAGEGFLCMTRYNLVHKYAASNETSGCKSSIGQGMKES